MERPSVYGPSDSITTQIEALSVAHQHLAIPELEELKKNADAARRKADGACAKADLFEHILDSETERRDLAMMNLHHAQRILESGLEDGRLDGDALRILSVIISNVCVVLDEHVLYEG